MQKDQDWSGAGGLVEGLKRARGTGWGPCEGLGLCMLKGALKRV